MFFTKHGKTKKGEYMFGKKDYLSKKVDELNNILLKSNLREIAYLLGNKKRMFFLNFLAGIARGIGIGIGVTVITAFLVFILQKIVKLNIPVIGEFISDIVDIVQKNKY